MARRGIVSPHFDRGHRGLRFHAGKTNPGFKAELNQKTKAGKIFFKTTLDQIRIEKYEMRFATGLITTFKHLPKHKKCIRPPFYLLLE